MNTAYEQLASLKTSTDRLTGEHAELYFLKDYFFVNDQDINFSDKSKYYCWQEIDVLDGETIDVQAQASQKGGDDLIILFQRNGNTIAFSHQEGATSPVIDDHSATLFYKASVAGGATETYRLCVRGDGNLAAGRMQWGYKKYYTQANWEFDNSYVPTVDTSIADP